MIYKGLIMSIEQNYAVVVTSDMKYMKIKKKNCIDIGKEVFFIDEDIYRNNKLLKYAIKYAAVFLIICLSIHMLTLPGKYETVTSETAAVISLDINPSMEIEISDAKKVIRIIPFNKEAAAVTTDSLNGYDISEAISFILNSSAKAQYITDEKNSVLLAVTSISKNFNIDLNSLIYEIENRLTNSSELKELDIYYMTVNASKLGEARKHNISICKYELYEMLNETDENINLNEIKNMSTPELLNLSMKNSFGNRYINRYRYANRNGKGAENKQTQTEQDFNSLTNSNYNMNENENHAINQSTGQKEAEKIENDAPPIKVRNRNRNKYGQKSQTNQNENTESSSNENINEEIKNSESETNDEQSGIIDRSDTSTAREESSQELQDKNTNRISDNAENCGEDGKGDNGQSQEMNEEKIDNSQNETGKEESLNKGQNGKGPKVNNDNQEAVNQEVNEGQQNGSTNDTQGNGDGNGPPDKGKLNTDNNGLVEDESMKNENITLSNDKSDKEEIETENTHYPNTTVGGQQNRNIDKLRENTQNKKR